MRLRHILLALLLFSSLPMFAQQRVERDRQAQAAPAQSKVYFGGGLGFTFGTFTRISVSPLVGYHLTPQISAGVRVNYEYVNDKRFVDDFSYSSYGGGLFGRYRFSERVYGHAEFDYLSYKFNQFGTEFERYWVPFLYLGGGYIQPLGGNTAFMVEVLMDVIQDSRSPYGAWQPLISFGVGVGF